MSQKKILLTGGTGFIGSHTLVELINSGYETIIVDNLSNSSELVINNLSKITKTEIQFYRIDITNKKELDTIFKTHSIDTVIHFAAYKSVSESVSDPLKYYNNNINGLISLLEVMNENGVKNIIFSSSATVYGNPSELPITESSNINILNPYGQTKLMGEIILSDVTKAYDIKTIILRYFNPVGAHSSGLIGESPIGTPNNLFPYILDVISGKKDKVFIYGSDYDTIDGTGVRDYIHVVDLAKGHVAAVNCIDTIKNIKTYNLGTGKGYSVKQIVDKFNSVLDDKIIYEFTNRREGDAAEIYADCSLANKELGWKAELGIDEMVKDSLFFIMSKK